MKPQSNGLSVLVHTETTGGHARRQDLTYRVADGIPVHVADAVDNQVQREINVEQLNLQWGRPPPECGSLLWRTA